MKRTMILVAVLMAAIVVLSGPVAGVLDLPEPTAEAKKKKKKKRPHVVRCQPDAERCQGTVGKDYLVGSSGNDYFQGGEGNDIYAGNGGVADYYFDSSTTSSDFYKGFPNDEFLAEYIEERGGNSDTIDLRNFKSTDFKFLVLDTNFDGAFDDLQIKEVIGSDAIYVYKHFGASGSSSKGEVHIERILFSDKTLSGDDLPVS